MKHSPGVGLLNKRFELSSSFRCDQIQSSDGGATTLSITTFNITTLSKMGLFARLGINDTQHSSIVCHYAECRDFLLLCRCRYAECRGAVTAARFVTLFVLLKSDLDLNLLRLRKNYDRKKFCSRDPEIRKKQVDPQFHSLQTKNRGKVFSKLLTAILRRNCRIALK